MPDWGNPYYVPVAVAVRMSAHKRDHIVTMARKRKIASVNINAGGQTPVKVVSLRDILILERNLNRRGQQSVIEILDSLVPTVYMDGEESRKVLNPWRSRGVLGRLRKKKNSIDRQESNDK